MASIIGDYFSIKYDFKSVYPSSFWITSLTSDARKNYNLPNFKGYYLFFEQLLGKLMKDMPDNFYTKLESCYPHYQTSQKVFFQDFYNYYTFILKRPLPRLYQDWEKGNLYTIKNLENILPSDCCEKDMIFNKESGKWECSTNSNKLETEIKFFIENFVSMFQVISPLSECVYKSNYNETLIKNHQQILKNCIKCYGPIGAVINVTKEYRDHFYKKSGISQEIFPQIFIPQLKVPSSTSIPNKNDYFNIQPVTILGWGKVENLVGYTEFWYIRDPNSSNYGGEYYKVAFSTMENIASWIGPDIAYCLDKTTDYIIGPQYFLSVKDMPNVTEYIKKDIFDYDFSFLL